MTNCQLAESETSAKCKVDTKLTVQTYSFTSFHVIFIREIKIETAHILELGEEKSENDLKNEWIIDVMFLIFGIFLSEITLNISQIETNGKMNIFQSYIWKSENNLEN